MTRRMPTEGECRDAIAGNLTVQRAALELKVGTSWLYKACSRFGIRLRRGPKLPPDDKANLVRSPLQQTLKWTEALDEIIRNGYAQSISARDITRRLSIATGTIVTRNMAIGRARRLGLKHERPARDLHKRRHVEMPPQPRLKPTPSPVILDARPIVEIVLSWRRTQCRWIEGELHDSPCACGNRCDNGRSYCPAHMQKVVDWEQTKAAIAKRAKARKR